MATHKPQRHRERIEPEDDDAEEVDVKSPRDLFMAGEIRWRDYVALEAEQ